MGHSYANISIVKDKVDLSSIEKYIIKYMHNIGLTLSDKNKGYKTVIIRNNPKSRWITVYDEDIDYEKGDGLSSFLARKLRTYCMYIAYYDSDDMIIHLSNEKEEDIELFGGGVRNISKIFNKKISNLSIWNEIAKNPQELKKAFDNKNILIDNIIYVLEKEIGICRDDIYQPLTSINKNYNHYLHFNSNCDGNPIIINGYTNIECYIYGKPEINKENVYSFINRGGISKGAIIDITCKNINNIIVGEIQIERAKNTNKQIDWENNIISMSAKAEIIKEDGYKLFRANFPDFKFPEGIVGNSNSLKGTKLQLIEFSHLIIVRFIPEGSDDSNILDLRVTIQPMESIQGYTTTPIWQK